MTNGEIASKVTWRKCSHPSCDEPTPWDMKAIIVDNKAFCSDTCATNFLRDTSFTPRTIGIHDPQYEIRDWSGWTDDRVVTEFVPVNGVEDAMELIEDVSGSFKIEWRFTARCDE